MTDRGTGEVFEQVQAMFVQTATSAEARDGKLVLRGLPPSTLWFSDRPERVVGHVTNEQFVDLWYEGDNSFYDDPPNAVLAFLEEGDERPEDVVVMLMAPTLVGSEMTYLVHALDAPLPPIAGPCTLFIDPIGRPLSPASVAGMHRRIERRRRRSRTI